MSSPPLSRIMRHSPSSQLEHTSSSTTSQTDFFLLKMESTDDQSDGECSFDLLDNDYCHLSSGINIQLKKDPKVWVARNPSRLWEVGTLKLELPDDIYNIPDSIWKMFNIVNLNIIKSVSLNCLLDRLPTLQRLRCLKLENCSNLSELPQNLGHVVSLQIIIIRNCGIKSLPDSLSQLQLAVLELTNCEFIQELPANLSVGIIRLVGCPITGFSETPSYLRSLEINCCSYAADILTVLKDYDSLQTLQIKGCDMDCFPNSITGICNLEELEIINCMNLIRLPEDVGQFVDLDRLNLVNCGIKYLCSGLCNLTSLSVNNCPMEFHVIKDCVSLTHLEIIYCCVKSLHGCVAGLTNLKSLRLSDCETMEDLPTGINTMVSLEELCIEGCSRIKFLPNLGALHKLKNLSLRCCFSLNELPHDFDKLTSLSSLYLTNTNIESLPSTITNLDKLRDLYLPKCFRFETLPDDLDLNLIRVVISPFFRLNTLPVKFSVKTDYLGYRLYLKTLLSEQPDTESVSLSTLKRYRERHAYGMWPSRKAKKFIEANSVEAQDGRRIILVVKAVYKEHLLRFDFLSTSSVGKLKEEVLKRVPLEEDRMIIKYQDEDDDWVLLACSDDLQHCMRLSMSSESKIIRLLIHDS